MEESGCDRDLAKQLVSLATALAHLEESTIWKKPHTTRLLIPHSSADRGRFLPQRSLARGYDSSRCQTTKRDSI